MEWPATQPTVTLEKSKGKLNVHVHNTSDVLTCSVVATTEDLRVSFDGLLPNTSYMCSVVAFNSFGASEPALGNFATLPRTS